MCDIEVIFIDLEIDIMTFNIKTTIQFEVLKL
jgi:hypothetical protein